jgi:hypothetical protein
MEVEGKTPFHLFSFSPQPISLKPLFFSVDIKVLFYHGFKPLFTHFPTFP